MDHETYMQSALDLARTAAEDGEVPVGCVIVWDGRIVGRGRNRREKNKNALAHAELEAIHDACRTLGGWRLWKARLYVTLEPCPMCAGAILNARIPEVFFGARDSSMGACGGVVNLFEEGFRPRPKLTGGILEEPCLALLQKFFQDLRTKSP
ncbi:MAG: nucleoside deaminase [Oscillospiraceae bacterium]|nr:nucleoside deaminase [Oscillospiraceae bacterium]